MSEEKVSFVEGIRWCLKWPGQVIPAAGLMVFLREVRHPYVVAGLVIILCAVNYFEGRAVEEVYQRTVMRHRRAEVDDVGEEG